MKKYSRFDLFSLGLLLFILIFSLARLKFLPQFIDGYYHLSVANGFIKSGGWTGWSWWDFAPLGRPQLYPPFYHLVLVFLMKAGLSGFVALKLTEALIAPVFFTVAWLVFRRLINDRFSFFFLLILSSFFPFYSAVSANVPASIAIIFGFLSWLSLKRGRSLSAALFLILCFYTHIALSWVFFIAYVFLAMLNRTYRKVAFKIIFFSLLFYLPFLIHQLKYASYIVINLSSEAYYSHFGIFILLFGVVAFFVNFRKRDFPIPLFVGYLLGSIIVFFKYPYRFFSAQGIIGFALFAALFFERLFLIFKGKKWVKAVLLAGACLFLAQPTISLDAGKPKLKVLDSTYYNIVGGKTGELFEFQSLYVANLYDPIVEVIKDNTSPDEIISSNVAVYAQMLSALSKRATINSMLWEVRPVPGSMDYAKARLIVFLKAVDSRDVNSIVPDVLDKVYENDLAYVFLNNSQLHEEVRLTPAKINFAAIAVIVLILIGLLIFDLSRNRGI